MKVLQDGEQVKVRGGLTRYRMQIKNSMRIAYALAKSESQPLMYEHLQKALTVNKDFDRGFRGAGQICIAAYLAKLAATNE